MSSFCMRCGAALPQGAMFCPKCGTKIEVPHCPACGEEVDFGTDFCIYCGHPLIEDIDEQPVSAEQPAPTESFMSIEPPGAANPLEVFAQQKVSSTPVQPAEEVLPDNAPQQFAWHYVKVGALSGIPRRHDFTVTVDSEVLHVTEQSDRGRNPTPQEADIALADIQELQIQSKASIPLWILYSFLATTCLSVVGSGVFDAGTYALLALFVALIAWLASFQLFHNELTIEESAGKKTVLLGGKRELFQQIQESIATKTNAQVKEPKSATAAITLSIIVGAIGTIAALWVLTEQPLSDIGLQQQVSAEPFAFQENSPQPTYVPNESIKPQENEKINSVPPVPTLDITDFESSPPSYANNPYAIDLYDPEYVKTIKRLIQNQPDMATPMLNRLAQFDENDDIFFNWIDPNNPGEYYSLMEDAIFLAGQYAIYEDLHCNPTYALCFCGEVNYAKSVCYFDIIWEVIDHIDMSIASVPMNGYWYAHAVVEYDPMTLLSNDIFFDDMYFFSLRS